MNKEPCMISPARAALCAALTLAAVLSLGACSAATPAPEMPTLVPDTALESTAPPGGAPVSENPTPAGPPTALAPTGAIGEAAPGAKLNVDTATEEELRTIPGVGDRMVREFQEYRPYKSILVFRKEIGKYVDAAQVAEFEKHIFVPVSPNDADADTLQQLPGVTPAIAAELIAGRPYAANADFLTKLASLVTAEDAQSAGTYLAQP
jgi:DNA uptake protein ComE-like DNA-binding protein